MNYLALDFPGGGSIKLPGYIPQGGLKEFEIYSSNFMLIFLYVGISLTVIYIVWGGMQLAQSQGDKQKVASARGRITWAIIGLIVLLLSYTIVSAVGYLFRVNLLKLT